MVSYASLATFMKALCEVVDFTERDRHLSVTKSTFDISLLDFLIPLSKGGTVVIADTTDIKELSRSAEILRSQKITSLQATPSYLSALVEHDVTALKGVRILVGGEALSRDLGARLLASAKEVWNLYGPTEATVWAMYHRLSDRDVHNDSPAIVTIGKPLPNYRVYLLAEDMTKTPAGLRGEICIAGPAVASGYWKQDDITRIHFLKMEFPENGRIYRTGDFGQVDINDNMMFLGRTDQQVKIHGARIELAEIEVALRGIAGVRDAAVVVSEDAYGSPTLTAYINVSRDLATAPKGVREELSAVLPDHMIPASIVALSQFPINSNGKLDRRALGELSAGHVEERSLPMAHDDARLCAIFGEAFGRDSVGINQNFLDLGGHSLMGMRLVNKIRTETNVDLPLRTLFEAATFADVIDEVRRRAAGVQPAR